MARKPWYESPVSWALFVLITGVLFVLRGPVIQGVETWADHYFSRKGMWETLAWASDDRVGIFAMLFRVVLGIIAGVFLFVFAVVVWVFLWGWRLYFLIPVAGGLVARGLRLRVEPFVLREKKVTAGDVSSAEETEGLGVNRPSEIELEPLVSRRSRVESWLRSEREEPTRRAETSHTSELSDETGKTEFVSIGWGFRRVWGRESGEETLDNRGKEERSNLNQRARLGRSGV